MTAAAAFSVECRQPWLIARLATPCSVLSWSPSRPGFRVAETVAWLEVKDADLVAVDDPVELLRRRLREIRLGHAVGLMTARDVRRHHVARAVVEDVAAEVLTTVGLTNGERVGERVADRSTPARIGTVNTLVHVSRPLTQGALVEASSLATQARTLAILEAGISRAGAVVTGTGTDCIVVAAPRDGEPIPHAGLHTAVGEAIGAAVLAATRAGVAEWIAEQAASTGRAVE